VSIKIVSASHCLAFGYNAMDYGYENGMDTDLMKDPSIHETTEMEEEAPTTVDPGLLLFGGPETRPRSLSPLSPLFGHAIPVSSPIRDPSAMDLENVHHTTTVTRTVVDLGVNPSILLQPMVSVPPTRFTPLPYASSRSGVVYDVRMRYHTDPRPDAFDPHPETPKRISEIFEELNAAGLVEDPLKPSTDDPFKLLRISIRQADSSEIALVHSTEHVKFVQSLNGTGLAERRV